MGPVVWNAFRLGALVGSAAALCQGKERSPGQQVLIATCITVTAVALRAFIYYFGMCTLMGTALGVICATPLLDGLAMHWNTANQVDKMVLAQGILGRILLGGVLGWGIGSLIPPISWTVPSYTVIVVV